MGFLNSLLGRMDDRIDTEVFKDKAKVQQFESRLREKPISLCGLNYSLHDKRWSLKPIVDDTGNFKWTVAASYENDQVDFGSALVDGDLKLEPIAAAVTSTGIYVAFRRSGTTKRAQKILFRNDPSRNRLFITIDGRNYRALEGTVDQPDIDGISIAAFPPYCLIRLMRS
jgi:hypothetical protein